MNLPLNTAVLTITALSDISENGFVVCGLLIRHAPNSSHPFQWHRSWFARTIASVTFCIRLGISNFISVRTVAAKVFSGSATSWAQ